MSPINMIWVAILFVGAVWFSWRCLADLKRAVYVRIYSREVWALIIILMMPIGGVLYLVYGKSR